VMARLASGKTQAGKAIRRWNKLPGSLCGPRKTSSDFHIK